MSLSRADLVDLARSLAAGLAARAGEADRAGRLPEQDLAALRDSGYLRLSVPEPYGGLGRTLGDCVAAQHELAQGSASTAMIAAMQLQVFGHQRETRTWRPDAYETLCRAAAEGGLFNFIASEPEMGSPSRGGLPATTAELSLDGQHYLVNGHKTWATGGRYLTHLLVRVNVAGQAGVVYAPGDAPGIEWQETWRDALSLRASESHDVHFRNVRLPAQNLIETGDAKAVPNVWFPLILSAVYLGTATAARNCVVEYALERTPTALGKPIAALPKIQRQIGELDAALLAARALLFETADAWRGEESRRRAGQRETIMPRVVAAKLVAGRAAGFVTEKALEIAGGASLTRALPLERYFRDARPSAMQPPAGDTAYEIVGRAALGL